MTGENMQSPFDRFLANKQQSYAVDPGLSRTSLTPIPAEEEKPGITNWVYSDPPVLRNSRLGSNWRHMSHCHSHIGNHMMFVDGMVKQVDGMRYPPYGSKEQLAPGIPNTSHNPKQQLKQHSQYAQTRFPVKQATSSYEIGNRGLLGPSRSTQHISYNSYGIDPLKAYRMGVQHGFNLSNVNLNQMFLDDESPNWPQVLQQQPPPPKQAWQGYPQYDDYKGQQRPASRCGSARPPSRPTTADFCNDRPKSGTPPSTASSRKPSETNLDFDKPRKVPPTKPPVKPYNRYAYSYIPAKKKKTKPTMSSYRVMGPGKTDENLPVSGIEPSTYQYYR